jgi:hypothetical protein
MKHREWLHEDSFNLKRAFAIDFMKIKFGNPAAKIFRIRIEHVRKDMPNVS